jgi:hypothetical protein
VGGGGCGSGEWGRVGCAPVPVEEEGRLEVGDDTDRWAPSVRGRKGKGLRGALGCFAGPLAPGRPSWADFPFFVLLFFSIFLFPVLLFELAKVI